MTEVQTMLRVRHTHCTVAVMKIKHFAGIFRSNASIIEVAGGNEAGLFPVMSRMNHSCMPNTNFVWREDLKVQQVYAVSTICK